MITLLSVVLLTKVAVLFTEEAKLYLPDKRVTLTPHNIGLNYDDLYFKTEDGQSLNGWFIPAQGAQITLLYCAGRGGNMSSNLVNIKFFNSMRMNVFVFDYRGFGNSSGSPSEQGLYKDARAAYDFLVTRSDINQDKIVAYGKSLGAPVAADLCLNRKVAAMVLEGSFPSLRTYVSDLGGFLPLQWLVSEKFDTIARIKKIHIPKLIVHGMDDDVVPFPEGRFLFNEAALPKEFLPYDGGHDDDIFVTSDTFRDRLNNFLENNHVLRPREKTVPSAAGTPNA